MSSFLGALWNSRLRGGALLQLLFACNSTMSSTLFLQNTPLNAANGTETSAYAYEIAMPGKLRGIVAQIENAHGASQETKFVVRIGGNDTALEVSFATGETAKTVALDVPVVKGDLVSVKNVVVSGTPTGGGRVHVTLLYEATGARSFSFPFRGPAAAANATQYINNGDVVGTPAVTTPETLAEYTCPYDGFLTDLAVHFLTAIGASTSAVVTVRREGAPTAITVSCPAGTLDAVAAGSVAVSAGDTIAVEVAWTGSNTRGITAAVGGERTADTQQDYLPLLWFCRNVPTSDGFMAVNAGGSTGAQAGRTFQISRNGTLTDLWIESTTGVLTDDVTFTIWKNNVSTGVQVVMDLGEQTLHETFSSISVVAGDLINLKIISDTLQNGLDVRAQLFGVAA